MLRFLSILGIVSKASKWLAIASSTLDHFTKQVNAHFPDITKDTETPDTDDNS